MRKRQELLGAKEVGRQRGTVSHARGIAHLSGGNTNAGITQTELGGVRPIKLGRRRVAATWK